MRKTKIRCYHLHADRRKIRRLTENEHHEAYLQDVRRSKTRLLARVSPNYVWFSKGKTSIHIPREQLQKILGDFEKPNRRA